MRAKSKAKPRGRFWIFWGGGMKLSKNTGTNVCTFYPHGIYRYKMLRIVTWFHLEFLNAWPYSVDRRDYGIWSLSDLTDFWFLMKWNINGKYQRAKSKFTKVFFNSWNRLKWHFQRFDSFLDVRPNEYKNCTIENFDRIYRENKKGDLVKIWLVWNLGPGHFSRRRNLRVQGVTLDMA